MTVVAVASLHGAPGVTTLVLDLAGLARAGGAPPLVVEADPDGGRLAARLDLALAPGITELAGAARAGIAAPDLWRFAQRSREGWNVIVAHPAAEQVHAALRAAAHHIGASLRRLDCDVFVDCGRLRPGSPAFALAACADHVVVVSENGVESAVSLAHRAPALASLQRVTHVITSSSPFAVEEIAAASRQPIWGVVPPCVSRSTRAFRGKAQRARRDAAVIALHEAVTADTSSESGSLLRK